MENKDDDDSPAVIGQHVEDESDSSPHIATLNAAAAARSVPDHQPFLDIISGGRYPSEATYAPTSEGESRNAPVFPPDDSDESSERSVVEGGEELFPEEEDGTCSAHSSARKRRRTSSNRPNETAAENEVVFPTVWSVPSRIVFDNKEEQLPSDMEYLLSTVMGCEPPLGGNEVLKDQFLNLICAIACEEIQEGPAGFNFQIAELAGIKFYEALNAGRPLGWVRKEIFEVMNKIKNSVAKCTVNVEEINRTWPEAVWHFMDKERMKGVPGSFYDANEPGGGWI